MDGNQDVIVRSFVLMRLQNRALGHAVLKTNIFPQMRSISLVLQSSRLERDYSMSQLLETLGRNITLISLELSFNPIPVHRFGDIFRGYFTFNHAMNTQAIGGCSALKLLSLPFWRLRILKIRFCQTHLADLHAFLHRHLTVEELPLAQCAAIAVREPGCGAWQTVVDGRGHTFTMVKNARGFATLERQDMQEMVLCPASRRRMFSKRA